MPICVDATNRKLIVSRQHTFRLCDQILLKCLRKLVLYDGIAIAYIQKRTMERLKKHHAIIFMHGVQFMEGWYYLIMLWVKFSFINSVLFTFSTLMLTFCFRYRCVPLMSFSHTCELLENTLLFAKAFYFLGAKVFPPQGSDPHRQNTHSNKYTA